MTGGFFDSALKFYCLFSNAAPEAPKVNPNTLTRISIVCLWLMVPAGYFGASYLSQKRWAELWHQCTLLDYEPRCHIKAIAKHHNPMKIVPEILKYQVKESDLISDRAWLLELTNQLHNTKSVAVGGVLRSYLKALEQEPEDLIGKDEEDVTDEGHLYFEWQRRKMSYKLKS